MDVGKVPLDRIRGRIAIERVPQIDKALDTCNIDIVDRSKIEDHGSKVRQVAVVNLLLRAWAQVEMTHPNARLTLWRRPRTGTRVSI